MQRLGYFGTALQHEPDGYDVELKEGVLEKEPSWQVVQDPVFVYQESHEEYPT